MEYSERKRNRRWKGEREKVEKEEETMSGKVRTGVEGRG